MINLHMQDQEYVLDVDMLDDDGPPRLDWIDHNWIIPPSIIQSELWLQLQSNPDLFELFKEELGPDRYRRAASCLSEQGFPQVAIVLIEEHLELHQDQAAYSVLCSALRKVGRSQEALDRTGHVYIKSVALATTRAAAFCDIEEIVLARKEANKAMAISGGKSGVELIAVYTRIKQLEGRL